MYMKHLKFLITFLASIFIFFGCNTKEDPNTIEIWYSKTSTEVEDPPVDWFVFDEIKKDLGLTIILKSLPSSINEQNAFLREAGEKDKLPDLFKINHEAMIILARSGKIIEVDQLYDLMPERSKIMYEDRHRIAGIVDDKRYGLIQAGGIVKNEGLVIRKDWLDNLGLKAPVTIDDFYNVMYAFTYNDPDKNGFNDTYGFGAYIETNSYEEGLGKRFGPIMGAFGVGGTWNAETKVLNVFNSHFYEALSFIQKMNKNKLIDPSWSMYKKEDFRNAWKSGKFGCMKEQYSALFSKENYTKFDQLHPEGEWIVIQPPIGPYGQSVSVDSSNWRAFAISDKAKKNGKVTNICRLLEWMSTKGYYSIMYGKEGVNFVFDAVGNISNKVPNPELAYTNQPRLTQLRNFVQCYSIEELRPQKVPFFTKNGKYIDPLEKLKDMQKCPWSEPLVGFPSFDKDLRAFYKHGLLKFAIGQSQLTEESFNKWLNEFKARGGEKLQTDIKELK